MKRETKIKIAQKLSGIRQPISFMLFAGVVGLLIWLNFVLFEPPYGFIFVGLLDSLFFIGCLTLIDFMGRGGYATFEDCWNTEMLLRYSGGRE